MSTELSIAPTSALAQPKTPGVYDPQVFQQLMAIADAMAQTSLIPETLTKDKNGMFPLEKVRANCFLVAEQSHRWGMSPFAVAQAASVVYGRLMWEGKLVAAVIEQNAGIRLNYEYSGQGDSRTVVVTGQFPDEDKPRTVQGSVSDWKTDQWKKSDYDQRLAYRGAREWARRHCPGVMLGVITSDEADDYEMRDVTPPARNKGVARTEMHDPYAGLPAPTDARGTTPAPSEPTPKPTQTATTTAAAQEPADKPTAAAAAAYVVSASQVGDEWIVVLKGAEREIATVAENSDVGRRANELTGLPCWVNIKKRGDKMVLTSIKLKEEEGALL